MVFQHHVDPLCMQHAPLSIDSTMCRFLMCMADRLKLHRNKPPTYLEESRNDQTGVCLWGLYQAQYGSSQSKHAMQFEIARA